MKKLSKRRKGQIALIYIERRFSEKEFRERLDREARRIAKAIDEHPCNLIYFVQNLRFGVMDYDNHVSQRIAFELVKNEIKNRSGSNPLTASNRRRIGNTIIGTNVSLSESMAFVREILHEIVDEVFYPPKSKENSNQG